MYVAFKHVQVARTAAVAMLMAVLWVMAPIPGNLLSHLTKMICIRLTIML
jgi:hypothetical protein